MSLPCSTPYWQHQKRRVQWSGKQGVDKGRLIIHLLEDCSIRLMSEQDEQLAQLRSFRQQLILGHQLQHMRSQRLVLVRGALPYARPLGGLQQGNA